MSTSSKRREKSRKVDSEEGRDRISNLPDEVIGHILSFLPTKHAVGTSILSHRWQYLFTLVTNLDFDESLVFNPENTLELLEHARLTFRADYHKNPNQTCPNLKCKSSFKDFVDRVLMLRNSLPINKFRFKCGRYFDCSNLNAWIRVALLRGVAHLDISTGDYDSNIVPCALFNSEKLVVLKLQGNFNLKLPSSFHLPNLKTLHLTSVKVSEDSSLNRFVSGLPMLEDLVIIGEWEDINVINIASTSLRRLTMNLVEGFGSAPFSRLDVTLDLPNLLELNYVDYLASNYLMKNMNALKEASIEIFLDYNDMGNDNFGDPILGLMNGVSNAEHLCFSGKCMEALACDRYELPVFRNLSFLELGGSKHIEWRDFLREILHSSPVLEHLDFPDGLYEREEDDDYSDKNFWRKQQESPPCLVSHLETVTIESFNGFKEELRIAEYFLRHGKVLTELILDWSIGSKQEYRDLKKLEKARINKGCSIEIE